MLTTESSDTFEVVWTCGLSVGAFAEDHMNWGFPILGLEPGCPFPNFDPPRFTHTDNLWFCDFISSGWSNVGSNNDCLIIFFLYSDQLKSNVSFCSTRQY